MEKSLQTLNRQEKLAVWSERIAACRSSGISVRAWCEGNGISTASYYKWQKKLFCLATQNSPQFAEVCVAPVARISATVHVGNVSVDIHAAADPTVMLNDFTGAEKVYIACGYTDLRRGIDGLASIVQQQFQLDPFTNTLFLFCGRRRDRIKALYWEGDGFLLLYKRLESGSFQWPRSEEEARLLTPQQYRWLMEGLNVEQPKAHRPVRGLENI